MAAPYSTKLPSKKKSGKFFLFRQRKNSRRSRKRMVVVKMTYVVFNSDHLPETCDQGFQEFFLPSPGEEKSLSVLHHDCETIDFLDELEID